jgi:site-specific recombinase XerD
MATVKVVLRENKLNPKTGVAPLYLRIIKDRKAKFISLGVKVKPKYWNEESMTVKKGYPNYSQMNDFISKKRAEAENTALNIETKNKSVTTKRIKEEIMGKPSSNFFHYAYSRLENIRNTHSPSTYRSYNQYLKKLEHYIGSKKLAFDEIDIPFIKAYENYLYKECENKAITVEYSFRCIKLFYNLAIKEELADIRYYPFHNYTFTVPRPVKNYLNKDQLDSVLNYKNRPLHDSEVFYDMFIFASYAGGLRFFDILDLKWMNINEKEQKITKVIRKTKRKHQFKLPEKAIEIINKYNKKGKKLNDHIFPLLRNDFDYEKFIEVLYDEKSYFNSRANKTIGKMGTDLELPFPLSFHTSRHTFATSALTKGMRIEHVSKILDHTEISTTQIYAKIVSEELDKAMEIMNN